MQQYLEYIASELASAVEALSAAPVPLLPADSLSLEDFTWAFAVLRSRCFPPLVKERIALVPLADVVRGWGDGGERRGGGGIGAG